MIVVYVFFWLHVLGINYVTAKTNRLFGRFIANIFYILSFSVFPFRFFEVSFSSIILAAFIYNNCIIYNSMDISTFAIDILVFLVSMIVGYKQEKESRRNIVYDEAIEKSRKDREQSMSVLLPLFVAKQLLYKSMFERNKSFLKRRFRSATVFQSDLIGFTELSSTLDPSFIVSLLHYFYSRYDQFAVQFNVEKIETIGLAFFFFLLDYFF
ncbi:adenylyl/guanylyl cyclase domain-containing protein [Reticulomyxa filosa]|uniref:Adenylyl/guanylyl cyclase domain-containing protein n=1 Tax=Reticulomyxa filosa TaxID=46433 RepID=X6LBP4_RETFI|nr:adenylyl/guanylyl cyclase domain-containing protein [Reticulomyxa filosa]|eukprot:ETN98790.1 adenylyl/guanylyl cyclase domain-containing protein [Reticulomyxa filosa]